jgi:hypothetical protein
MAYVLEVMKSVDESDILFHTTSEKRKPPEKEEISMSAQDFVRDIFAKYYEDHCKEIIPPSSLEKREFGFLLDKEKIMVRHKNFGTPHELQRFIVTNNPSDVYYSSAYYEFPTEPMERKNWLGADLIFDIDSDHWIHHARKDTTSGYAITAATLAEVKNLPYALTAKAPNSKWRHGSVKTVWTLQRMRQRNS